MQMRYCLRISIFFFVLGSSQIFYSQNTPCGSVPLPSDMTDFDTYSTGGLSNSGIEQPDCGGAVSADIWFETTVGANGYVNIVTLPGGMTNAAMAIYSGNCNNPLEIACTDDDNCGNSIMPILALYNQPPGSTIYIRIWAESGSNGTFDILIMDAPALAPPLNLTTVGSAAATSASCVQLTTASGGQSGCAWDPVPFDFSMAFEYNMVLNFGNSDAGADGICLVFQNDPAGLSTCGNTGGDIAAAGTQNSFIIEFDTYDNGAGVNDIAQDHVAVGVNGDIANPINGPFSLGNIEDGADHEILFTWDPATNAYEIQFDGAVVASGNYDIINNCFGGLNTAWGGFTASTGGAVNNQTVCTVEPENYPSGNEALVDVEICEGEVYLAGGSFQSTSGIYQDTYASFTGCDSIIRTNLIVHPTAIGPTLEETICPGDCFFYNGQPLCAPGLYEITLLSYLNCDSIVQINLTIVDLSINILPANPLTCDVSSVILDATNSASGTGQTFQWAASDVSCISGDLTAPLVNVSCPGIYTFWVFQDIGTEICMDMEEVEVLEFRIPPNIDIATPDELSCAIPCTIIDAGASDGGVPFTHTWSGPNSFTSNMQNPEVCAPGIYQLIMLNTDNGCSDTAMVEVLLDDSTPFADAGNDGLLNCINNNVLLDGSNSSQGGDFILQWTDENDMLLSETNSIQVNSEGLYILSVFNAANGCVSMDTVEVTSSYAIPTAVSSPDDTLDCATTDILLDGSPSISSENYSFSWQTVDGTELSTDTAFLIDIPAVYMLIINNLSNGCADTTSTVIIQDLLTPTADAGMNQNLDCNNNTVDLNGVNSSGAGDISFQWLDNTGLEIGTDTAITVNSIGLYELIITNINNNCTDTTFVSVLDNVVFPMANAGLDTLLNCSAPNILLDNTGSDTGNNFTYEWQDESGSTIGNMAGVDVENTGIYTLIVNNTTNGCSSSDDVFVGEDFILPFADAGMDAVLDCINNASTLDGSASDMGSNFSYEWQDGSGNPIGQNITQEVNAADTYTFIITNDNNGCRDSSSLMVSLEINAPTADAGLDLVLNCAIQSASLDGSASSNGANIIYEWTDANDIVLGNTALLPVSNTGTYSLEVFNTDNGCTSISNAVVSIDTLAPPLANLPDIVLNCNEPERILGNLLMNLHPNWTFDWQNSIGNNIALTDTLLVNLPDIYTLEVTNTDNFCTSVRTVTVSENFVPPIVDLLTPDTLDCNTNTITLDAGNSDDGIGFALSWQDSQGEIIAQNTNNVAINEAGNYTLNITNLVNGCSVSDAVFVEIDTIHPIAIINEGGIITCTNPMINLDGSASSSGSNISLTWLNSIGDNLASTNQLSVNEPDTYTLLVGNNDNGCETESMAIVSENTLVPIANAGLDYILNCYTPTTILSGQNDGTSNTITYEWQNQNGDLLGEMTDLSIEEAQNYTLIITDTENGCIHQDEILVSENFILPVADAGQNVLLDCITTSTILGGINTSIGTNFEYEWQNTSGNVLGASIDFTTETEGIYTFIVLNMENGCADTTDVGVTVEQDFPIVNAEVNELLTCVQLSATLDGSASSTGSEFEYQWNTISGGNISTSGQILMPFVEAPGTYELVITNVDNGCENSVQVEVEQDIALPIANAGLDFDLNCHDPISYLNAGASTPAGSITFFWSTGSGQFESDANIVNPAISSPGIYELVVTDINNGCVHNDQISISSNFITALETETVQPLCYEDRGAVFITNVSGGLPPFLYSIDGGNSYSQSSQFTNLEAGEYDVVIQDANACEIETTASLNAPAEVLISLEPQVNILLGDAYQLFAQTNIPETQIGSISWTPLDVLSCNDCLDPIATPYQTTSFIVTLADTNNCSAQAITQILVDKTAPIYIPNVFSPNGDGTNDVFMIFANLQSIQNIKTFAVYNRWGENVFEAHDFLPNDPDYGWGGNNAFGKIYNAAVFVYYAEIEFIDGRVELFKGDVTLVR